MFKFLRRKAKKFGEIAVEKGLVSEDQVREALDLQEDYAEKHQQQKEIGAILTEKGYLTPQDVAGILEEQKSEASLMAWFSALFGLSR
jgi:hypothetical protein